MGLLEVCACLLDHFELLGKLPLSHICVRHVEAWRRRHLASYEPSTQAWHVKHAFCWSFEVDGRPSLPSKL